MKHCMIDIETAGHKSNAIILTIGGVKFEPHTDNKPSHAIYLRPKVDQQTELGRTLDDETIEWWGKQPKHVWNEAFGDADRTELKSTVDKLTDWLEGVTYIWSQGGAGFDMKILEDFYKGLNINVPWKYYNIMDSRTLIKVWGSDPRKKFQTGDLHNALSDAYTQAQSVQYIYDKLGLSETALERKNA